MTVNEVANELGISVRSVQLKCKKANLIKRDGQYIISKSTLETWRTNEAKNTEKKPNEGNELKRFKILPTNNNEFRFRISQIVIFVGVIFLMVTLGCIYKLLQTNITDLKHQNKIDIQNFTKEKNSLNKRLNDANDVINYQKLEIQYLQIKDSLRLDEFKP